MTRAGQSHTHLFDLALLTDQLLALNQKGQVGVLGEREGRTDYAQLFQKGAKGGGWEE